MARNTTLVGIDVAKAKVDAAIRSCKASGSFENTSSGRQALLAWLKQHTVGKAVMEATGGYERSWAVLLRQAGIEVVVVDPKRVRHFAKSAGQLAKNDPIDAAMIAWFGEVFSALPGKPHDGERQELEQLVTARMSLVQLRGLVHNWSEHEQPAVVGRSHARLLKAVAREIAALEALIDAKLETDRFAQQVEIIRSVPGLGDAATAGLIAFLPELGQVDRQAACALSGVAPFDDDSGQRRGERHIKGGRHKLRRLLYMPIVAAATRFNPVLKSYYQRLVARGKKRKVALIACMRKLIGILNTMMARGEKWDPRKQVLA